MPLKQKTTSCVGSASKKSPSRTASNAKKQKRQATLYDAVAGLEPHTDPPSCYQLLHLLGRVSSTGFIPPTPRASKHRDTLSSSTVPNPPEEVLFRRAGAPIRYEECDIYWADRHLTEKQKLPESDLLKAVHVYTSDFYRRATSRGGVVDFESLDETALLGLGMLLEVVMGEVLGETGDLAFVEGEEGGGGGGKADVSGLDEDLGAARGKTKNTPTNVASKTTASGSATTSGDERRHKKRKLTHEHNNEDEE